MMTVQKKIHQKSYPCPKRHKIAYIWTLGEMPAVYKDFVERCKHTIVVLNDTDFKRYLKMWNEMYPEYKL
jgi:hypothetical protein